MHPLLLRLADGSPGVLGAAPAVAREIADDPDLLAVVVDGLASGHEGVRNRSANALDRATRQDAAVLQLHREALLAAADADLQGATLRRLLPLLLRRLQLDLPDARRVVDYSLPRADRGPVATRSNALDALASTAGQHPAIESEICPVLEAALDDPGVSHRARARLVLARLDRQARGR
ncbi:MAG: hypothetical protein AAGK21_06785 [Bacteroidota bacterium]